MGKDDVTRFRCEFSSSDPKAPTPYISHNRHLWPSAERFVGYQNGELVTGNIMDLDRSLSIDTMLEINLIRSMNRAVYTFSTETVYRIGGTRDARAWSPGYTTLPGEIALRSFPGWVGKKNAVIEFTLRFQPDDQPPAMNRTAAKSVTPDKPFDFKPLYERDTSSMWVAPAGRQTPVFMDDEPVMFSLNVPQGVTPKTERKWKWFHLVATYDGRESVIHINGKQVGRKHFGSDPKPLAVPGGVIALGGAGETFVGALDNVRIYRRVLNDREILRNFEERKSFRPAVPGKGAKPPAAAPPPVDDLALSLDFNQLDEDNFLQDSSPARRKVKLLRNAALCEGADGYAVHFDGSGVGVKIEMDNNGLVFDELTIEAWISPEQLRHSNVIQALGEKPESPSPFAVRWRVNKDFWLDLRPAGVPERVLQCGRAVDSIEFPKSFNWFITNTAGQPVPNRGDIISTLDDPKERRIAFGAPKAGVYILKVQSVDDEERPLDECFTEFAIAGEVKQPLCKPGEPLPAGVLQKVDEADLTATDPGHDFFSFSGQSKIVKGEKGVYRQTLTYQEELARCGGNKWWANDWFAVRFKTEPGKVYVVETEHPDLDFMSVSQYLIEPKDDPADGKCKPVTRTTSGVFTGTRLPFDNGMKTYQTVHFASAPWVAVCYQNGHSGRPEGRVMPPASIKRVTLYEVKGELPRADIPSAGERYLGVHCEHGGVALGNFGPEKFRGENADWNDWPGRGELYRKLYPTVVNLIKYMRHRGDNVLLAGVYRYRSAWYPSTVFPPGGDQGRSDIPDFLARMFEKNGLKLVLTVMPCNPLPAARLHEATRYDIIQGGGGTSPVGSDGQPSVLTPFNPAANPFHPKVREAYNSLAADLGSRYGRYPAVLGIAWVAGSNLWEPCLPIPSTNGGQADQNVLTYSFDDETMRQFAAYAKVTLPGKPGEPDRFKKRYDWIMTNAKEKFVDFRCWATAQTQFRLKDAFRKIAQDKDYLYIDYYHTLFNCDFSAQAPLDICRLHCSDPRLFKNIPGFVHMPWMPERNCVTNWEHGRMSMELAAQADRFLDDKELAQAMESEGRTARYLHRQFYEQSLLLEKDRPWLWAPGTESLACCSYPQQGGRGYLADFVQMLAMGTPDYLSYMWSDSQIPMGHEMAHQEFAAAFRALPPGHYKEADRKDGVIVRFIDVGQKTFYAVNTSGSTIQKMELKTGLTGEFVDAVAGEAKTVRNGMASFTMRPYSLQVFTQKK